MRRLTTGQHVVRWVAKQTNEHGDFNAHTGIGIQEWQKDHWQLIAGVAYANWNGPNVECHIASNKEKNWATRGYLWRIFAYPFEELKANRITAVVGEGNTDSRNLVERMGFTEEARLAGAHPTGDLVIYCMKKESCRFLGWRPEPNEETNERMAA